MQKESKETNTLRCFHHCLASSEVQNIFVFLHFLNSEIIDLASQNVHL